ncbi:MAG: hypothetical protein LBB43_07880 [Spirochaetaceae bacterium]|jgi:DNA-directed RNA polymerase subunit RPC12/RpoP|nr:hypothetical protein [Spirochaetaceae bacterium]
MTVPEYKCPSCGAGLVFDNREQKMFCRSCRILFDVESLGQYEEEANSPLDLADTWQPCADKSRLQASALQDLNALSCPSCGAELAFIPNNPATNCPYCGNGALNAAQPSMLKPDLIIPFKLDKDYAEKALADHLHGKALLPTLFKTQSHIDSIQGIYVPCRLFNCTACAHVQYQAIKKSRYSNAEYDYTRTDYYNVHRYGIAVFENVPVDASLKMDDAVMESIEPFDYREAVDFQSAYLAGYLVDACDLDAGQAKWRALERIKKTLETLLATSVLSYSSVTMQSSSVQVQNGFIRYVFVPVWMLTTLYEGKRYCFAINGQTGKLVSDLPVSRARFWAWFLGLGAALFVFGALLLKVLI